MTCAGGAGGLGGVSGGGWAVGEGAGGVDVASAGPLAYGKKPHGRVLAWTRRLPLGFHTSSPCPPLPLSACLPHLRKQMLGDHGWYPVEPQATEPTAGPVQRHSPETCQRNPVPQGVMAQPLLPASVESTGVL